MDEDICKKIVDFVSPKLNKIDCCPMDTEDEENERFLTRE